MTIRTPTTPITTQEQAETAPPAFKDDGTPKVRTPAIGNHLYLQIAPSKIDANGDYSVSRSWLFRASLDGRPIIKGMGALAYVGKPNKDGALTLEDAKLEARGLVKLIKQKIDPVAQARQEAKEREKERERPAEITFAEAAEAYATAHEAEWSGKGYRQRWLRALELHAYPMLGNVPVADVNVELILRVLEPLWAAGKTKSGRDVRGRISDVIGWAMAKGHRPRGVNPASWQDGLEHLLAKPRAAEHHPALHYSKVGAFMAELRGKTWLGAKALEFALLNGNRANEVLGAKWGEITWDAPGGPVFTVPKERMKRRIAFPVPLSKPAIAILEAIRGDRTPADDELVFHGKDGGMLSENSLLRATQRIDPTVTQHAFRSSLRDWAADRTNFPREVAEAALAHAVGGVEGAYRRSTLLEKRRELLTAWAEYLAQPEGANVVTLKPKVA